MEERPGEKRRCAHCHGLGLADQLEWIMCPGCDGVGEIAGGACIHCDGSGGESVVIEIACPQCMGAGFIVSGNTFGGSIPVDPAHGWRDGR